tara:strand:+ start:2671 stop:4344 length:1674 start_codon:yes stop_codon:yes gene_type:complete
MLLSYLKENKLYIFFATIYIFSLLFVKEMNFLFYNTTDSPDFNRYFRYLEYNVGIIDYTDSEQGFAYYDIQSLYFYLKNYEITSNNFFVFLGKSIQEVNFILFLIGSAGVAKLLSIFKYNKVQILVSLIFINFLPISISQRIVFKPEILAFALFPWVIVFLEEYFQKRNNLYIFTAGSLSIILFSQKGSIFAMTVSVLILYYFLKFLRLKDKKNVFFILLPLIALFVLLFQENNQLNQKNIFDIESISQRESQYDNKGSLSLLYKVNPKALIYTPYKDRHNYSAIHITLLDSFGDYFDLYWDDDSQNYFKGRRDIIKYSVSQEMKIPKLNLQTKQLTIYVQETTDNSYLRKTTSLFISLFFYFLLIKHFFRSEKSRRKFFTLPFIGFFILTTHIITGFPENNFDPNIGDTLKPLYYSFLIVIGMSFLIAEISNNKIKASILLAVSLSLFMFLYGFPKNYTDNLNVEINELNSYSLFCKINPQYFNFKYDYSKDYCYEKEDLNPYLIEYDNFQYFEKQPNFHLFNYLILLTNILLGIFLFARKKILRKVIVFDQVKDT